MAASASDAIVRRRSVIRRAYHLGPAAARSDPIAPPPPPARARTPGMRAQAAVGTFDRRDRSARAGTEEIPTGPSRRSAGIDNHCRGLLERDPRFVLSDVG